jgi:hypothetical protein
VTDLWLCERCNRTFANRNQTHTCGRGDLDAHFARCEPHVRELFDAFVERLRALGPFEILPEKTRIAFHVRMSFAVLATRRAHLVGHLVLAQRVEDPRFTKIESLSARNHVHSFRISTLPDVERIVPFLSAAYAVGGQKHRGR